MLGKNLKRKKKLAGRK